MTRDQMADRVVHVVGIGLGTAAAIALVVVTAVDGEAGDLVPILIYAIGVPWLASWDPAGDGVAFGWSQAYKTGVQPFILGDLVKLAFAAALLPAGWALLQKTGVGRKNEDDGPKAGIL